MEHIIVTDLDNGYKKLVPEEGYRLLNKYTQAYYTEAIVKNTKPYVAVKID